MEQQTCPRCGKQCIEVKDMGKTGKLFIHEYINTPVGPAPDAHRISVQELAQGLTWTVKN